MNAIMFILIRMVFILDKVYIDGYDDSLMRVVNLN